MATGCIWASIPSGCCRSVLPWRVASATTRFLFRLAVTAAGGALAHLITHLGQILSHDWGLGAVSGMMAAAMRFAFPERRATGVYGGGLTRARTCVPAEPLMEALRNPRVLIFIVVWFVLNLHLRDWVEDRAGRGGGNRLAGACRRISGRFAVVSAVRSGPAASRRRRCAESAV